MAQKSTTDVYKPQYAACRDVGHEWDYFEWYGSKRILICANCNARREDIMNGNYEIVHRTYKYPTGYAWHDTAIPIKRLRAALKREARKLTRWVGPKPANLRIVKATEGGGAK